MTTNKKRNPDHVRQRNRPSASNTEIERQLQELLTPAVLTQAAYYRQLQMRDRILNLPLMVALVLTLLWRQVPSVRELARMLAREDLLWCRAVKVSQQALCERFLVFPAELFERVYKELLPKLKERWEQRQRRPIPLSIRVASDHFDQILVADGSTLEALFRKLGSLEEAPLGQLAGKMCVVIDLLRQLPVELWFSEEAQAFDTHFIPNLLTLVGEKTLLIIDRGFYHFIQAYNKGKASDPVAYFAAPENQDLDIVKRIRKPFLKLDLTPYPT